MTAGQYHSRVRANCSWWRPECHHLQESHHCYWCKRCAAKV